MLIQILWGVGAKYKYTINIYLFLYFYITQILKVYNCSQYIIIILYVE